MSHGWVVLISQFCIFQFLCSFSGLQISVSYRLNQLHSYLPVTQGAPIYHLTSSNNLSSYFTSLVPPCFFLLDYKKRVNNKKNLLLPRQQLNRKWKSNGCRLFTNLVHNYQLLTCKPSLGIWDAVVWKMQNFSGTPCTWRLWGFGKSKAPSKQEDDTPAHLGFNQPDNITLYFSFI